MHKLIQRSLQDFCRNTNCIIVTREGRKREQIHSTHAFPPFFPLFRQSFHGEYLARSLEHIFAKIYPHCDPLLLFHDRISRPAPTSFPIRADSSAFPTRCRFFPSGSRIVDFGIEFTSSIGRRAAPLSTVSPFHDGDFPPIPETTSKPFLFIRSPGPLPLPSSLLSLGKGLFDSFRLETRVGSRSSLQRINFLRKSAWLNIS